MMKQKVFVNYIGDIGISIEVDGETPREILEYVFAAFNYGSGMEHPEFLKHRTRSLSVNDFVRVGNQWYQCMSMGWEPRDDQFVDDLESRVVNHPMYKEHGPWFALSDIMWGEKIKMKNKH
jgi:hypothetical protein